jgi:M6 family metalloprotease-like protein
MEPDTIGLNIKTLKKFIISMFLLFSMFTTVAPEAAPIRDFPVTLVQPDGEVIKCFVSGDEYFNYYHDAAGFKIIQNPATGYYTYAVEMNGEFVPSEFLVNSVSPKALGLSKTLKSPKKKLDEAFKEFSGRYSDNVQLIVNAPQKGTINNIVVFIRFSGEAAYTDVISTYSSMFNSTTLGANSMRNYFTEISYNQLTVSTTFYPTTTSAVLSFQDSHPRGYFQPYSVSNTIGYDTSIPWNDTTNANGATYREQVLIKNATTAISSQIPTSLNIDGDSDGNVDNVCFIVSGSPGAWSSLLWPHQWELFSQTVNINNKRVYTYNFQLRDYTVSSSAGVGVLAHEMSHSIGSPDLYHYTNDGLEPIGKWDLMERNMNPPQHMTAYMKYRYGNWIASIPTITTSGTYSLNPLTSATNNAYRINSPNSTTEYFIVEYRHRMGTFEASLPGEGLIAYRINTAEDGNGNSEGPPDEVYIYRPGGSLTANGSPDSANFGSAVARTAINDSTNPSGFLSSGALGGLNISNIGTAGSTISFNVTIGGSPTISLGVALDNTTLAWTSSGNASWFGQKLVTHDGVDAAQSGSITDGQASHLETKVTGPGTLTFYWKVSSESCCDYLILSMDGTEQFHISGEVAWQQKTVTIPSGQHTLRWSYSKDSSVSSGSDAGWLDTVVYTSSTPKPDFIVTGTTLTPTSPIVNSTFSAAVTIKNQGTAAGTVGKLQLWANQVTSQACSAVGDKSVSIGSLAAGASTTVTITGISSGVTGNKTLRTFVDGQCATSETNETNNQSTKTYTVIPPPIPDFVVTGVTLSPTSPAFKGIFSAIVTVKNQGTVAGNGGYIDVWANQTTAQSCQANGNSFASVGTLAAGASKTLTVSGLRAGVIGTKTLRVFVDSYCQTAEVKEDNNQFSFAYTVGNIDLVITSIVVNPAIPKANTSFSASVVVKNQGTVAGNGGYLDVWGNQSAV